jgi:hypothetical protein
MTYIEETPHFRRHLPDLLAGLAVFAVMLALTGWHIGIAAASDGKTLGAVLDRNASAVLLAGALGAMVVFNVAFVRHLKRAYALPRRTVHRAVRSTIRGGP